MKTIEEKAKAYDEALERARKEYKSHEAFRGFCGKLVSIFPELVENNDDKIINIIKKAIESKVEDLGNGVTRTECLAWLEKQGEQKYVDMDETKKIHVIDEGKDEMDYCFTKMMNDEKVSPIWSEEDDNKINSIKYLLHELDNYNFDNWLKSLKDRVQPQPKQEWSEEDEKNYKVLLEIYQSWSNGTLPSQMIPSTYDKYLTWFKSIKDRVRPKLIWSEEDEEKFRDVIRLVEQGASVQLIRDHYTNWLKLLKQKYNWEPSDEQLEALKKAIDGVIGDVLNWHSKDRNLLDSLYNNLKKLKE